MAKRAKDTQTYRPFSESLVRDVLSGPTASPAVQAEPEKKSRSGKRATTPASESRPADGQSLLSSRPDQGPFDPRKKLSREKRYLLSLDEEERIESLVRRLASELQTPLKLSHIIRACVHNLLRCEQELLEQARQAEPLVRPANGDVSALREYEAKLSRLADTAFRMVSPST